MLKGLVKATVPVVKLGVKVGLCGGAVYVTKEAGVWGDSKQGAAALKNLKGLTLKDVQTALGEDCPIAPVFEYVTVPEEVTGAVNTVSASVADVNKNFYSYYNCGVMTVLNGIRDLPDTASKYANQAVEAAKELSK